MRFMRFWLGVLLPLISLPFSALAQRQPPPQDEIDALTERLQADPADITALCRRGMDFAELGDADRAELDFRAAIANQPNNLTALHMYGWALCNLGRYQQALDTWHQEMALYSRAELHTNPPNWIYLNSAICYWNLGHRDLAIANFNTAEHIYPGTFRSRERLLVYLQDWTPKDRQAVLDLWDAWNSAGPIRWVAASTVVPPPAPTSAATVPVLPSLPMATNLPADHGPD
jgi:tetratricopeptide (TPR) repeat protein